MATLASSGCSVGEVVTLTAAPLSREAYARTLAWRARWAVASRYVFTRFDGRGAAGARAEAGGGVTDGLY